MEPAKKEEFSGLIKTLKEIKNSINQSIKYELIDVLGDIEEVKISFDFKYFPSPISSLEQTVNGLIFNQIIRSNTFLATDLLRFAEGERKEEIESICKSYAHIAELMQAAKSSLVVTKDGVAIGNTSLMEA